MDEDCDGLVPADELDSDGDGVRICDGDCDDADAAAAPGLGEVPQDGVDQNCDGLDRCVDLNCDGWPDLVVTNENDAATFFIDSYVYYGGPGGYSVAERDELPTVGSGGVVAADFDGDGYVDLAFANHRESMTSFQIDSYIYWGSAAGYSEADRDELPTLGAAESTRGT